MSGVIYLSPTLDAQMQATRKMIEKFRQAGKKDLAAEWSIRAIQITNQGCLEALDKPHLQENEVLLYMDQSGKMNDPSNKGKERTLELHLLVGSPLYKEVIALLEKHLDDGVK